MAGKLQDEGEVERWFHEGRTYRWMAEEYLRKYDLEVSPSMFSQHRRKKGWERRHMRDDEMIPWAVKPEHRWSYTVQMLRGEARRRAGLPVAPITLSRLTVWLDTLDRAGAVVHYEPDTDQGFWFVPKEPGEDLVRMPDHKTTLRRTSD